MSYSYSLSVAADKLGSLRVALLADYRTICRLCPTLITERDERGSEWTPGTTRAGMTSEQ